jgi:hypothetical protein
MHYYQFPLPASHPLAGSHNLVKANNIEYIVAPEFHFPFNGTYPSQLEIPEDENTPSSTSTAILEPNVIDANQEAMTAASAPRVTTQDRNSNGEIHQNKLSYVPITRPWETQPLTQPGNKPEYSCQTKTPLAIWERQALIEEPFSNIGEVAIKSAQRQQDESPPQACKLRRGSRKKRRGF